MESFGYRLSLLRKDKNKNIKDLAAAIGISIQAWTDYEKNRSMPQVEKLIAISKYFDVSVDYLLFGNDHAAIPDITPYYNSYISCLIELLSSGLLKVETNNNIFQKITFYSDDEIIKIFILEYQKAVKNNDSFLSREEMKELLNILCKRFANYKIND